MLEIGLSIAMWLYYTTALVVNDKDEHDKAPWALFLFAMLMAPIAFILGIFNSATRKWAWFEAFKWMIWPFPGRAAPFSGRFRSKETSKLDKNGNATALTEEQNPTRIVARTIENMLKTNFTEIKMIRGDEYIYEDDHYRLVSWSVSAKVLLELKVDGECWEDIFDTSDRTIISKAFEKAIADKTEWDAQQERILIEKKKAEEEKTRQLKAIDHIENRLFPEKKEVPMLEHAPDDTVLLFEPNEANLDKLLKELKQENENLLSI